MEIIMWIIELWNSLVLGQQVFICVAIPATILLLIMIVTMLIGMSTDGLDTDGDGEVGGEADTDGDVPDAGLSLFTSRGIIAMLAIMGWSGFILLDPSLTLHWAVGSAISRALGFVALVLVAFAMRGISKLQSSGNIDVNNAIGKVAQVYLTSPAGGKAPGKVNITIQERLTELSAITTASEAISTGSYVRVVSVSESGVLVVEPLAKK